MIEGWYVEFSQLDEFPHLSQMNFLHSLNAVMPREKEVRVQNSPPIQLLLHATRSCQLVEVGYYEDDSSQNHGEGK